MHVTIRSLCIAQFQIATHTYWENQFSYMTQCFSLLVRLLVLAMLMLIEVSFSLMMTIVSPYYAKYCL